MKEQGIDQLLDDARESNRENDLEHLKRTCESVPFHGSPDGKVTTELKAVGFGGNGIGEILTWILNSFVADS